MKRGSESVPPHTRQAVSSESSSLASSSSKSSSVDELSANIGANLLPSSGSRVRRGEVFEEEGANRGNCNALVSARDYRY